MYFLHYIAFIATIKDIFYVKHIDIISRLLLFITIHQPHFSANTKFNLFSFRSFLSIFMPSHTFSKHKENPENITFPGNIALFRYSVELSLTELKLTFL